MTNATDKLIADNQWRDISEAPHNVMLCVKYTNSNGKERRTKAIYYPSKTCPAFDSDFGEYDEGDDEYYCPEGWYVEVPDCLGVDYGYMPIDESPTHFRPLPDDRCANALKIAVEALREIEGIGSPTSLLASVALTRINQIASANNEGV